MKPDPETMRKITMFRTGKYRFKAPPVPTSDWNEDSWIRWVDSYNGWYNMKKEEEISPEDLEAAADLFDKSKGNGYD